MNRRDFNFVILTFMKHQKKNVTFALLKNNFFLQITCLNIYLSRVIMRITTVLCEITKRNNVEVEVSSSVAKLF